MTTKSSALINLFSGWDGYQRSLVSAIEPLSADQLLFKLGAEGRTVGEIACHIAFGRLDWFHRMGAPGAAELVEKAAPWWRPWQPVDPEMGSNRDQIIRWLNATWQMMEQNLMVWTVDDLSWSYEQPYDGKVYAVSRQWVIWRIMAHDIHHGGQISLLLAAQGIEVPDLGDNGGHIIEPPIIR